MDLSYVVIDTETSGTNPVAHEVLQIGAIVLDDQLDEIDHIDILMHFDQRRADPEALKMNSYDDERWLNEAVSQEEGYKTLATWLHKYRCIEMRSKRGNPYHVAQAVAYNWPFDQQFIFNGAKKAGVFLPLGYRGLDVLQLALWRLHGCPEAPRDFKLETVVEALGFEAGDAHDALGDVRMTAEVMRILGAGYMH